MTKFEDNLSPYLTIVEATEPSAPSAGQQRLYIDSTTHLLKATNSSGTDRTLEGGLADPMTTRGDVIVRNSSNVTARLAIGSSGKVLSSDGTDISWQTPSGGGSAGTTILLSYDFASDISNQALSANTAFDIIANQNFTVASASSIVEVAVRGACFTQDATAGPTIIKAVIDSAGTPITRTIGGSQNPGSVSYRGNPFGGGASFFVSGLTAATHTIKVQIQADHADHFYCRASSVAPYEFASVQVIEHKN